MASKYNVKIQYAAWMAVATLGTVVVMTGLHFWHELKTQEANARARALVTARTLAKLVETAVAAGDEAALPGIVARAVNDEEILYTRIVGSGGRQLYRPGLDRDPAGLIIVKAAIGSEANPIGTVEVGIGQASMSEALMRSVLMDLTIGAVAVLVAVGISFVASGPVRQALKQLQRFVKQVATGQPGTETLDSDLAEVDEVGTLLNDVVKRVDQAQQTLARAQKELKAAQKEMDEYTYVISHDLKEPLRGIEAFSKFLVEDYRDKLDEDGRHKVDVIRKSALRMQRLINDLLKFSRLGQQKNPMTPVGLNAMLMHVRLNLQYALDAKKVDLRVDKLPTVMCDATAMTEVFHNLISNAIKYNDKPHPVVEVGCREQLNPETREPEYVFHVRDNGIGIRPEYFEKIFQIFQRLQRDDEGTGIGLTIVKRVIEWHGGRIWLESEPGKGTTFYFTLPKRELKQTQTTTDAGRVAPKGHPEVASTV
jgi:signal transduction histidine kinase